MADMVTVIDLDPNLYSFLAFLISFVVTVILGFRYRTWILILSGVDLMSFGFWLFAITGTYIPSVATLFAGLVVAFVGMTEKPASQTRTIE